MNAWQDDNSATNYYYDSDYPGEAFCRFPENFDEKTIYQGLRFDVARYLEIAEETGGPVLELCCGTGRVAMPLAAAGHVVVGVDYSTELVRQFQAKLEAHADRIDDRISIVEQDVTQLSLARQDFKMAVVAFNSLICLPEFLDQCRALTAISQHLSEDGLLLIDIVNPLKLPVGGDPVPKPFFTRRNPHNGHRYTRFAMMSAFDASHRQQLEGWYDETDDMGVLTRRSYSVTWRPIFRFEIELMLREAGLTLAKIEGGHRGEPYTHESPRMFIHARKASMP